MSFDNGGTTAVKNGASKAPDGFVETPVTTFSDQESIQPRDYIVLKSDIENATATDAYQEILDQVTAKVTTEFTADYDTGANVVDVFTEMINIENNQDINNDINYTIIPETYTCTCRVFVKTN